MFRKMFASYPFLLVCIFFAQSEGLQIKAKKTSLLSLIASHPIPREPAGFGVSTIPSPTDIDAFKQLIIFKEDDPTSDSKEKSKLRHLRQRRYLLHASKLKKTDNTWAIASFSKKMNCYDQKVVLEKAFQTWAAVCKLSFMCISDVSKADIVISFLTGKHGHVNIFDKNNDIIGDADYPSAGSDIHFNDHTKWVIDESGKGGISLLSAALRLIGHSVGLRESQVPNSVMFKGPIKNGRNKLSTDDIKGIQAHYGNCTLYSVDAVQTGIYGHLDKALVYKNEWVWDVELATGKVNDGYPKKIADFFNNVLHGRAPFKTVFYEYDYQTYVFMHDTGYTILDDHPKFGININNAPYNKYSYFPFLKSAPDAAFADPNTKHVYHFFQGSQYYKFDNNKIKVVSGYPKAISIDWPGVPSNLDTAFYNYATKSYYFIKKDEYYIFDPVSRKYINGGILDDIFHNICPT